MKTFYTTVLLALAVTIGFAQQRTYPVTQILPLNDYLLDTPAGTYYKDLNNDLLYYQGTWKATSNRFQYTMELERKEMILYTSYEDYYFKDKLYARFKVINTYTNTVLLDMISPINPDIVIVETPPSIKNIGEVEPNQIRMFYMEDRAKCMNQAEFNLQKVAGTTNQLKYKFLFKGNASYNSCNYPAYSEIPFHLPTFDIVFTKQ